MEKKTIALISVIAILVIIIGFLVFTQFSSPSNENYIVVGNTNFTLPEGFHVGATNKLGDINITNGTCTVFISKHDSDNITTYVKGYEKSVKAQNGTITLSNVTVDNITVCKSVNNQSGVEHFWFTKNGKVFSIYEWKNYSNFDDLVFELIRSTN